MTTPGATLLGRFSRLRVTVIGDVMLDSYAEGSAARICQEAPVPILDVRGQSHAPGGAANTAANAAALGADVRLLGVTGDDAEGDRLRDALQQRGICPCTLARQPDRRTLAKQRLTADGQLLLRVDSGTSTGVDAECEQQLIDQLTAAFPTSDAVIVSDYGYGVMTPSIITTLARLQHRFNRVLVIDAKRLTDYRHAAATAVKPNYAQALALLGDPAAHADRAARIASGAQQVLDATGARIAAMTLDVDGALICERDAPPHRTYSRTPQINSHAAGAGDTFLAAMTLALAAGAEASTAGEIASAAASVVVTRDRTAACSLHELNALLDPGSRRVNSLDALAAAGVAARTAGHRVVFTNGCFDILHRGHITHLNAAKALGDLLFVGINSDRSVRALKGAGRPVNPLDDRIEVLSALSCVDSVIPFDDATPVELVRALRPDIFVKGGDYTRDRLPEADVVEALGGTVHLLPYVDDHSTTGTIDRIRDGSQQEALA